jgi:hypothetical protein
MLALTPKLDRVVNYHHLNLQLFEEFSSSWSVLFRQACMHYDIYCKLIRIIIVCYPFPGFDHAWDAPFYSNQKPNPAQILSLPVLWRNIKKNLVVLSMWFRVFLYIFFSTSVLVFEVGISVGFLKKFTQKYIKIIFFLFFKNYFWH